MGNKQMGLIAALAAVALMILPASLRAADLPTKAPRLGTTTTTTTTGCTLQGCTGWHVDFSLYNTGTGVNILDLGQINANGTSFNIGGGWQYFDGQYWLGARADIGYDLSNGNVPGFSGNNITGHQMVELGGNIFGAFGLQPPNSSGLQTVLTSAVPTADIGVCEHGKAFGLCSGATLHYLLTPTIELDVGYINFNPGTTAQAPGVNSTVENTVWLGGRYHF